MTKLFNPLVLLVLLALPALAVQPAEGETLAAEQTFTYWLQDRVGALDPAAAAEPQDRDAVRQLFEGLMNEGPDGTMVPGVAISHQVSADGLTHTFVLREASWSDGEPVTADDFVHGWRRVADPKAGFASARFLTLMNVANARRIIAGELSSDQLGVRALDERTLQVTLDKPTPHLLKMLADPATYPVPRKVIDRHGSAWTQPGILVGNGAFVLQANTAGEITFVRNPAYWDAGNVVMQALRGVVVNGADAALARHLAGDLDRAPIPAGRYGQVSQDHPGRAVALPVPCTYFYVLNLSDKGPAALKDIRVRQALSLALDRDGIVDRVLRGGQRPALGLTHWAIADLPAPAIAGMTPDQRNTAARVLMAQAGFGPANPLSLTLHYNTDEHHKALAIAAQQSWKPLGVKLALSDDDWGTHSDRMHRGDFDIARYSWCADYGDATSFLDWFRSKGPNLGGWNNAAYDRLMAEAERAPDPAAMHAQAEGLLATELPAIFVYHYARAEMIDPAIRGLPTETAARWYGKDLYRVAD
ncbi:peptide ABC transporter substrate-binding protein [Paracoccus benzoatiresistens]|uniref:Peptide ABC transporter substrate-binding protein n=1 Tax=Paracoccus benzoatiresistens TaxID=2997341 RepID=A0ABT4J3I5_9RHOB|nr:peptide ABC transporter substrate-binding protein [Paracoccus sp. EF6]MCZ0961679.1 peptide ABC transporter substrate-binding protein [Paracoccus sp. EF6]